MWFDKILLNEWELNKYLYLEREDGHIMEFESSYDFILHLVYGLIADINSFQSKYIFVKM